MFKKSSSTKQFDMFNSPSSMMCDRESRYYDDPSNWHMKFYEEITSKIDETIFKPLFTEGNEGGKDGRPNASIRIIIAMCVMKEGYGYSDEALFEICRFHVLYRRALGLVEWTNSVQASVPTTHYANESVNMKKNMALIYLRCVSRALPKIR